MDSGRHSLPIVKDAEADDGLPRRSFLQLMGAGLALGACSRPGEILPYSRQPRNLLPGQAQHYATTFVERGHAQGVIARSVAGRPVKIDGNPDHPATLGGSSTRMQASLYDLYDPARGGRFRRGLQSMSWKAFLDDVWQGNPGGEGHHFLLEPTSSPLLIAQIERVRRTLPQAQFHFYDPLASRGREEASRAAFGSVLQPHYRFDQSWVVASFDADFLCEESGQLRYARDFSMTRRVEDSGGRMSRLWVAEGDLSLTGSVADERMRVRPSQIPELLAALVGELARQRGRLPQGPGVEAGLLDAFTGRPAGPEWIAALAEDLLQNPGASLVLAGERQPRDAHVLAYFANQLLGNVGKTLHFSESAIFEAGEPSHDLQPLADALEAGAVDTLVILGGDPARTAPADLAFGERLGRARRAMYWGLYENDTSLRCAWYLPALHYLEQWGDARAYDGTVSLIQPLINPLRGGRSASQVLAAFAREASADDRQALRTLYASVPDEEWKNALQWGFLQGALPLQTPTVRPEAVSAASRASAPAPTGLELSIRQDLKLLDGAYARNPLLVELPDPVTHQSWGNAATLSPATARRLGIRQGQVLRIRSGPASVEAPALPVRGMADDVIGINLGWGQDSPIWVGGREQRKEKIGTDAYPLRTTSQRWFLSGIQVEASRGQDQPFLEPTERHETVVLSQPEREQHGRPLLLSADLPTWQRNPNFVSPHDEPTPDLYGNVWAFSGQQWGMSIDLNRCLGCSACVVACQVENNIPTVGKANVAKGRLMHWLRIDRYYLGAEDDDDDVQFLAQPMLCQHCERAPCEYVCPVNATVHSPDGLNEMVYNRCIGTRFCSNNCPYKIRRFNWLRWNPKDEPQTLQMAKNPGVTVRERGVMEKCTYCVHRIREADIHARVEQRALREGEVRTACQEACPTQAIVFGLISDPQSEVTRLRELPRAYAVLNYDLGTEPRTRYVAHLRNPSTES